MPPSSLLQVLSSAIPSSVISQIVNNPNAAKSLASQFNANSPPAWYTSPPSEAQRWFATANSTPSSSQTPLTSSVASGKSPSSVPSGSKSSSAAQKATSPA